MPGGRKINVKSGVAAAVGASDADKCVVEVSARAKRVESDRTRIWFMGKKITVCPGTEKQARNALKIAWAKKEEWAGADWKLEKYHVIRDLLQGITQGGCTRFKTDTSESK